MKLKFSVQYIILIMVCTLEILSFGTEFTPHHIIIVIPEHKTKLKLFFKLAIFLLSLKTNSVLSKETRCAIWLL